MSRFERVTQLFFEDIGAEPTEDGEMAFNGGKLRMREDGSIASVGPSAVDGYLIDDVTGTVVVDDVTGNVVIEG